METEEIKIRKDLFERLNELKRPGETINDVIERLPKINDFDLLLEMAGTADFGDYKELINEIYHRRKEWR